MAISFVQSNGNFSSSSVSTLSATFSSNVTAGNLLVIAIGFVGASTTVSSVTDTLGNTYSRAVGPTIDTNVNYTIYTYYTTSSSTGSNTVTVNSSASGTFFRVLVHEYSGVNTLDVVSGATASNGTIDSGSKTTYHADELIFGWGSSAGGTLLTGPGTGFTQRESQGSEITEDKIVSATGSYDASYPADTTSWACQMATFYQAAGTVYRLWPQTDGPTTAQNDMTDYTLAVEIKVSQACNLTSV